MKFRKNCQSSDEFFRKITSEADENLVWNSPDNVQETKESLNNTDILMVKEETPTDLQTIKDEPFDNFNIEDINSILEDRSTTSAYLNRTRKKESLCESSANESEDEEENGGKSSSKRSSELQDFEVW